MNARLFGKYSPTYQRAGVDYSEYNAQSSTLQDMLDAYAKGTEFEIANQEVKKIILNSQE